jgi:hypothetical protein
MLMDGADIGSSGGEREHLIRRLTTRIDALKAAGLTERAAVRATAAEVGMHPMRVKRLAVLFPEA